MIKHRTSVQDNNNIKTDGKEIYKELHVFISEPMVSQNIGH